MEGASDPLHLDDHSLTRLRRKLLLCETEPLKPPLQDTPGISLEFWQDSRKTYVDALLENMQAPDGSYLEGLIVPGVESLPRTNQTSVKNLDKNNPLSLDTEVCQPADTFHSWLTLGSEESVDRLVRFRRSSQNNLARRRTDVCPQFISDSFP
jgi:hypothetical protein